MKTLFLASYFAAVENLFKRFLKQHFLLHKVLFIPTAGNVESYVEYIDEAINIFHKLGFEVDVLDIAQETEEVIKEKLNHTPILYISGGNTFYLLQELKRKHLVPHIKKRIDEGMLYLGESAGAIITASDIEYNQIMDDKNIAIDFNQLFSFKFSRFCNCSTLW